MFGKKTRERGYSTAQTVDIGSKTKFEENPTYSIKNLCYFFVRIYNVKSILNKLKNNRSSEKKS